MNREEILNYNKRCAEFLEYEFDELSETYETPHLKLVEPQAFGDEQFSCKLKIYELDFHSDWNWIMEVIKAIEELDIVVLIGKNTCVIEQPYGRTALDLKSIKKDSKQEAVVQAIDSFLKFYNKNLEMLK